jgi:hypothetical protein
MIVFVSNGDFSKWLAAVRVVVASHIKSVPDDVHVVYIFLKVF